jgi:hypothetical protein
MLAYHLLRSDLGQTHVGIDQKSEIGSYCVFIKYCTKVKL